MYFNLTKNNPLCVGILQFDYNKVIYRIDILLCYIEHGEIILHLAILGLLLEKPMHGYELNKQLSAMLGTFKALSYGSLYPNLKRLTQAGFIEIEADPSKSISRKAKKVYRITDLGKEHFSKLTNSIANSDFNDEHFSVHYTFFDKTAPDTRVRILEGRRRKIEQRRENLEATINKNAGTLNRYLNQLCYFKLKAAEDELNWINEQINQELQSRKSFIPPIVDQKIGDNDER